MSRTTDPRRAIQDLLESSNPETVIQYDGTSYRVAPSGDKRDGFYEILTGQQADSLVESHKPYSSPEEVYSVLAEVMDRDCELWLRSARYNESLATTATDL